MGHALEQVGGQFGGPLVRLDGQHLGLADDVLGRVEHVVQQLGQTVEVFLVDRRAERLPQLGLQGPADPVRLVFGGPDHRALVGGAADQAAKAVRPRTVTSAWEASVPNTSGVSGRNQCSLLATLPPPTRSPRPAPRNRAA